jgi:hypothetical protein
LVAAGKGAGVPACVYAPVVGLYVPNSFGRGEALMEYRLADEFDPMPYNWPVAVIVMSLIVVVVPTLNAPMSVTRPVAGLRVTRCRDILHLVGNLGDIR